MVDEEVRAAEAFSAVLHTLRKRVSGALISESCWDSIHELTGGIPFDACAMFGLELHLSDPDPFAEPNVPLKPGTFRCDGVQVGSPPGHVFEYGSGPVEPAREDTWLVQAHPASDKASGPFHTGGERE